MDMKKMKGNTLQLCMGLWFLVTFEIKHKTLQKELVLQKKTATYGFYKQFSKN